MPGVVAHEASTRVLRHNRRSAALHPAVSHRGHALSAPSPGISRRQWEGIPDSWGSLRKCPEPKLRRHLECASATEMQSGATGYGKDCLHIIHITHRTGWQSCKPPTAKLRQNDVTLEFDRFNWVTKCAYHWLQLSESQTAWVRMLINSQ